MTRRLRQPAFTLLEILLVTGLLAVLAGLVMPAMIGALERKRLPESANQMRALVQLTRANAMYEGRRHRIRFPVEDDLDELDIPEEQQPHGGTIQPVIEVERDPVAAPEQFDLVKASWARGETLKRGVRCALVRMGKPTIDLLLGRREAEREVEKAEEDLDRAVEVNFDEGFPPLVIEADGTCEWVTFLLTDAPEGEEVADIDPRDSPYEMLEVIVDGLTGLAWLQRPLYEEELELFRENGWPPVLRRDFLNPVALTEDNVLEIRLNPVR